jgi:hypothetical protein
MGNVFGEAPNTAGEGARAPQKSRRFSGYSFHGIALNPKPKLQKTYERAAKSQGSGSEDESQRAS